MWNRRAAIDFWLDSLDYLTWNYPREGYGPISSSRLLSVEQQDRLDGAAFVGSRPTAEKKRQLTPGKYSA